MENKMKNVMDLRLDLKICEGCGALWLRATEVGGVHCVRCTRILAEFPQPRTRRSSTMRQRPHRARRPAGAEMQGGTR